MLVPVITLAAWKEELESVKLKFHWIIRYKMDSSVLWSKNLDYFNVFYDYFFRVEPITYQISDLQRGIGTGKIKVPFQVDIFQKMYLLSFYQRIWTGILHDIIAVKAKDTSRLKVGLSVHKINLNFNILHPAIMQN